MAFSMFLRSPACSRAFSQQVMKMAAQPSLQRPIVSALPITSLALKESNTAPILNAVRSLRTSCVRLSFAQEKGHDHSKLWIVEKGVSAALIPLIPVALLIPNKLFDSLLAILITAHTFWGLEACVVEYARVLVVGTMVPKVAIGVVYACTTVLLGGLYYLIFNDIGLCRAYWRIWKNMRKPKPAS